MRPNHGAEHVQGVVATMTSDNVINAHREINGVSIHHRFKDVKPDLMRFLYQKGVRSITIPEGESFSGNSYEMSLILALKGNTRIATGEVIAIDGNFVEFGPVRGVDVKDDIFPNVLTYKDVDVVEV